MTLFSHFERRPEGCSALYVGPDNIDNVARYYAEGGYHSNVSRGAPGPAVLTIEKDGHTVTVKGGQVLVYGHPPTVVEDMEEFQRTWRPERDRDAR